MANKDQLTSTKPRSATEQDSELKETILINRTNSLDQHRVYNEPEAITIKPGTILNNRFDILEVIGSGGMGTVYKALDKRDIEAGNSYFIAIKVLNNECKNSAPLLKALYEETKKTQSLSHQNIVTVYDFDRISNLVYMTMEWIEGAPLDQIIRRNPLGIKLPEAVDIITQIGNALSYAHNKHIIHLDLKPGNIYFDRNKCIKILDFGIAQKLNSSLADNDEPCVPMALTPSYASIELLNDQIPSPRDDIYAFACVCYEVLTGKHPYNRERSDIAFKKKLVPKKIKSLNNQQWKALKKALALQQQNRTESIDKFLQEFNAKRPTLKYILFGVLVALLLAFTYYQFQAHSKKTVAIQQKKTEEISPFVDKTAPSVLAEKLDISPYKKIDISTPPKQVLKKKTDASKSDSIPSVIIKQPSNSNNKISKETAPTINPIQKKLAKEQGKITLWTDNRNYKIGSTLTLNFDVDRALYVQIFIVNSVGKVTTIFPNPYQLNNLLKPNKIYQIPPKNAEFTLDISGPKGKDSIIALASSKPFPPNTLAIDKYGKIIKNELIETYIQFQTTYHID